MLSLLLTCTVTTPAQISARHLAHPYQVVEHDIEVQHPDDLHSENETSILEDNLIDVHNEIITGGLIQEQLSSPQILNTAQNRATSPWWSRTDFGRRFTDTRTLHIARKLPLPQFKQNAYRIRSSLR